MSAKEGGKQSWYLCRQSDLTIMGSVYSDKILLLNILPGGLGATIPWLQTKITAAGTPAQLLTAAHCRQGWHWGTEAAPWLPGRVRQVVPDLRADANRRCLCKDLILVTLLCTTDKERASHALTG